MRLLITAGLVLSLAGAAGAANLTGNIGTVHGTQAPAGCVVTCPAGSVNENEPVCYDGYYDNTNGGCNSTGWTALDPQSGNTGVGCGQAGTYYYGYYSYRDTDWWLCCSDGSGLQSESVEGEFDPMVILIYAYSGVISCSNYTYVYTYGIRCNAGASTASANCGAADAEFWPWVGTQVFGYGVPCGSDYVVTVDGIKSCGTVANEASTWGNVKALYH
jgi:hypothetical protein